MIVSLTGATGVLGGHILRRLLADGHSVRALVRIREGRDLADLDAGAPGDIEWIPGGLDDVESLDRLVAGTNAVVHCAFDPSSDADQFVDTNVAGTLRLLHRVAGLDAGQFVFVSSLSVYGTEPARLPGADHSPLDEDFPLWPNEFYGAHKLALEKMVIAAHGATGLNASAWRVGCVLGEYPDTARDHLAQVFESAATEGAIKNSMGAYVITAADVAEILGGAVGDADVAGKVINTFDRWLDFATLADEMATLIGRDVAVECPPAVAPSPGLSNQRLLARRREFGTDAELSRLLARLAAARA